MKIFGLSLFEKKPQTALTPVTPPELKMRMERVRRRVLFEMPPEAADALDEPQDRS